MPRVWPYDIIDSKGLPICAYKRYPKTKKICYQTGVEIKFDSQNYIGKFTKMLLISGLKHKIEKENDNERWMGIRIICRTIKDVEKFIYIYEYIRKDKGSLSYNKKLYEDYFGV